VSTRSPSWTYHLKALSSISAVLAGGTFPGPTIAGNKVSSKALPQRYADPDVQGDTFVINVFDELNDTSMDLATSIVSVQVVRRESFSCPSHVQHWHGIDQHTFNAVDGAAFVTQCPIIPGNAFQYKFNVPEQTVSYERSVASLMWEFTLCLS
jgi:iron transport multicopper oxidase